MRKYKKSRNIISVLLVNTICGGGYYIASIIPEYLPDITHGRLNI